jgi:sucrose-6-phosphate hydrolase SacC (GH32 family)
LSGVLDWGETYAYLGMDDPVYNRRLLWCWIYEDDNAYGATAKGWAGSLGLPRWLTVNTVSGVTDPVSRVTEKGYWEATEKPDGTFTIRVSSLCTLANTRLSDKFPFQILGNFDIHQRKSSSISTSSLRQATKQHTRQRHLITRLLPLLI